MSTFENTVVIKQDRVRIYEYLLDLENLTEWNYAVLNVSRLSGGLKGAGATYVLDRKVLGKHVQETLTVALSNPPNKVTITASSSVFPATMDYELHTNEMGETILKNTATLHPEGLFKYFGSMMKNQIKAAVEQNLYVLRNLLENKWEKSC